MLGKKEKVFHVYSTKSATNCLSVTLLKPLKYFISLCSSHSLSIHIHMAQAFSFHLLRSTSKPEALNYFS